MKMDCQDYRKSMELLSLKMQLEKGVSDPEKMIKIKKRIEILQRDLKME